jgi:RNA polymerase-binding transcription factor DksA
MDTEKIRDARRRLSSAYENLVKSINRRSLAEGEIKLENTEDKGPGQYGKCVRCGKDIDEKRLAAVPWAIICLACREETA